MPLYAADSGKYKDLLDQNPHVRFFSQNPFGLDADSSTYSYRPQIECAACRWLTAQDYADLRRVSALAAHFAVNLEKALKVPIGIVETALSEAPIQSWIDRRTILLAPAFVEALKGRGLWVEEADWQAESRCSLRQPAALFNHKIAPLSGMHVRGFLLSQGENEVGDEDFYAQAFALQLKSWQTVFRPVPGEQIQLVYTGLAPACYAEHSPAALPGFNLMLAGFRKRCELPTGFVAVQDLDPEWESNPEAWRQPRHPAVKREWAERAATIALGLTYRRKLPPTSPEVSRVKRVDNKLMLSFRHLQQPLTLRQGDRVLKGFAVCGADQVFRNAEARLLYGLEVMVWHPDIEWPRQVTYAYSEMCTEANLRTGENLAVAPFSTLKKPGMPAVQTTWMSCDRLTIWAAPFDEAGEQGPAPRQLPIWKPQQASDLRLKIETYNKLEGAGALEVSYVGDRADFPVLSPELDYQSMRPRLNLQNYDALGVWVFNPDGRRKEIRLAGTERWLSLEAGLRWQFFEFPLQALKEQQISDLRIDILDKVRAGIVLFDHFTLKRRIGRPYVHLMPASVREQEPEIDEAADAPVRPSMLNLPVAETAAPVPEGRDIEVTLRSPRIKLQPVQADDQRQPGSDGIRP
jgi:hypothetical protein